MIVPVFRHSVFLADAVQSALQQDGLVNFCIVIVNDGCPNEETHLACKSLSRIFPDKIYSIRQRNAGLSAARNAGIDFVMENIPSVNAFYFLDSDNLISSFTLNSAYSVLQQDDQIGWVYPDVVMFGSEVVHADYSGPYSIIRHLHDNVSEAGSMVSLRVFKAGCRYDEDMKQGFEDWEFWWQCIEHGFIGKHVPDFGFKYRKRPESMLSESVRTGRGILNGMQRKHKKLVAPRALLSREAVEVPRYAIINGHNVTICTDPTVPQEQLATSEYVDRFMSAVYDPWIGNIPLFMISCSDKIMNSMNELRITQFIFWWIHSALSDYNGAEFVAVEFINDDKYASFEIISTEEGYWPSCSSKIKIFASRFPNILHAAKSGMDGWTSSLFTACPAPKTAVLRIGINKKLHDFRHSDSAIYKWFDVFDQIRSKITSCGDDFTSYKSRFVPPNQNIPDLISDIWSCGPLLPIAPIGNRDIAFILPIIAFGGVEKVALRMAEQFKAQGWRCHLLVLSQEAQITSEWTDSFASISLYYDERLYLVGQGIQYMGSNYPNWSDGAEIHALEGLLLGMNAVINFHSAVLHSIVSKLRRAGVVVCASMHVNDRTSFKREAGHNFLTIGYEHVYDLLAPCSNALSRFCHSMGVPKEKIVMVPNAPGYNIDEPEILRLLNTKKFDAKNMNVLFIGRFDRQKGLDRLSATIENIESSCPGINFKLVGRAVIGDSDQDLASLADYIEKPAADPESLNALFEWADILFMPSHWEGLPLTILEAQRLGVIPLVADVGAVSEAITPWESGVLIPDTDLRQFVAAASDALKRLYQDPVLRKKISDGAAKNATRNWMQSCQPIIDKLAQLVDDRI